MSRFVIFFNRKKSNVANPRVFAGGANSRGWGRAEAPGPARGMFKSRAEARINITGRRSGPAREIPISLVVCPAWHVRFPDYVLSCFALFLLLLDVSWPRCARWPAPSSVLWAAARCPQPAHAVESVMPLYRPSIPLGAVRFT